MGEEPNTILMAVLRPKYSSWETLKAMVDVTESDEESIYSLEIGGDRYSCFIMGECGGIAEDYQIDEEDGSIVCFNMVTSDYGDSIEWGELYGKQNELDLWAKEVSEKHDCTYCIKVGANYW